MNTPSSDKQIYVINGYPGSGKTTFGKITGEMLEKLQVNFLHTSSVDPIKHILMPKSMWNPSIIDPSLWRILEETKRTVTDLDWDGATKDVYWRGVMSSLKQKLTEAMPSLVQNYIFNQVVAMLSPAVIFVDIREPENIDALKEYVQTKDSSIPVKAVFIESDVMAQFDNSSDARVEEYTYEVYINNTRSGSKKSIDVLRKEVAGFCTNHVLRA